jgi:hypothetical protein
VTILAVAVTIGVFLVIRRHAVVGIAAMAVFFVGSSISVEARTIRPWEDAWSSYTEIPDVVHRIGHDGSIGYDLAGYVVDAADMYQLELTDVGSLLFFDSRTTEHRPGSDLVIASPTWTEPGARLLYPESGPYRQALWVRAGDLQDRLDAEGMLVPAEYSAPLSLDARRATLDVRQDGDHLTVRIRNDGSTWLPVGPIEGVVNGTVRLGLRVDGNEGADVTVDLPHTMLPGDEVEVRVPLEQLDRSGTHDAEVLLRQEGVAWWDESAVALAVSFG